MPSAVGQRREREVLRRGSRGKVTRARNCLGNCYSFSLAGAWGLGPVGLECGGGDRMER